MRINSVILISYDKNQKKMENRPFICSLVVLNNNKKLVITSLQANRWCTNGIELLASQRIEQCSNSIELAERYLKEIKDFVASSQDFTSNGSKDFRDLFQDNTIIETNALIAQVDIRLLVCKTPEVSNGT